MSCFFAIALSRYLKFFLSFLFFPLFFPENVKNMLLFELIFAVMIKPFGFQTNLFFGKSDEKFPDGGNKMNNF